VRAHRGEGGASDNVVAPAAEDGLVGVPVDDDQHRMDGLGAHFRLSGIPSPGWLPGTRPATGAFFDRVLTPGFAFPFYEDGERAGHEKLLVGRTAELLVTMDMPAWVYRFIYREPGTNAVERSTLGSVGIRTTRVTPFGPVKESTPAQCDRWLDRATRLGHSLADGPEPCAVRLERRLATATRALRLQFLPDGLGGVHDRRPRARRSGRGRALPSLLARVRVPVPPGGVSPSPFPTPWGSSGCSTAVPMPTRHPAGSTDWWLPRSATFSGSASSR